MLRWPVSPVRALATRALPEPGHPPRRAARPYQMCSGWHVTQRRWHSEQTWAAEGRKASNRTGHGRNCVRGFPVSESLSQASRL